MSRSAICALVEMGWNTEETTWEPTTTPTERNPEPIQHSTDKRTRRELKFRLWGVERLIGESDIYICICVLLRFCDLSLAVL
jgi:hypothetical protein